MSHQEDIQVIERLIEEVKRDWGPTNAYTDILGDIIMYKKKKITEDYNRAKGII